MSLFGASSQGFGAPHCVTNSTTSNVISDHAGVTPPVDLETAEAQRLEREREFWRQYDEKTYGRKN